MSTKSQHNSATVRRGPSTPFDEVLRQEMRRRAMTPKAVADQARLQPALVRDFLSGARLPTRREFTLLGHALGHLSYLFPISLLPGEEGPAPRAVSGPDAPPPPTPEETPPAMPQPNPVALIRLGKQAALLSTTDPALTASLDVLTACMAEGVTLASLVGVAKRVPSLEAMPLSRYMTACLDAGLDLADVVNILMES